MRVSPERLEGAELVLVHDLRNALTDLLRFLSRPGQLAEEGVHERRVQVPCARRGDRTPGTDAGDQDMEVGKERGEPEELDRHIRPQGEGTRPVPVTVDECARLGRRKAEELGAGRMVVRIPPVVGPAPGSGRAFPRPVYHGIHSVSGSSGETRVSISTHVARVMTPALLRGRCISARSAERADHAPRVRSSGTP